MFKALTTYTLLFLTLCTLWRCQSENDIQKESVERALDTYIRGFIQNADSSLVVDSLLILRVDSISSKDLMLQKIGELIDSVENKVKDLKLQLEIYDLSKQKYVLYAAVSDNSETLKIFKDELDKDWDKLKHSEAELDILKNELDSINNVYESGTIDSTDFLFLRPYYRICISNKLLEQQCSDGNKVLITKAFRVKSN